MDPTGPLIFGVFKGTNALKGRFSLGLFEGPGPNLMLQYWLKRTFQKREGGREP